MEDKRIGSRLRDLIEYIGENPDRQSLDETPGWILRIRAGIFRGCVQVYERC